jgi:6-phosphogluconate dehydrogenase
LDLVEIAKIWRGGCIIRAALLEDIRRAFAENPDLPNLIMDEKFIEILQTDWSDLMASSVSGQSIGVPTMCMSAASNYFQAYRRERLPANLIQAQRDYFGAHTYQRLDEEGIFHTPDWEK